MICEDLIRKLLKTDFPQNLLTSEQSCIILKAITKLPNDLAPYYYPTLLTIIWENPAVVIPSNRKRTLIKNI